MIKSYIGSWLTGSLLSLGVTFILMVPIGFGVFRLGVGLAAIIVTVVFFVFFLGANLLYHILSYLLFRRPGKDTKFFIINMVIPQIALIIAVLIWAPIEQGGTLGAGIFAAISEMMKGTP